METWRNLDAHNGGVEPWRSIHSHFLDEEQDPDPHPYPPKVKSHIRVRLKWERLMRIRIEVMRIRNPAFITLEV
jgi:hypothetical protein